MQTINLASVLPQVFQQSKDLKSEIWKQNVKFERGHLYLVEAESVTAWENVQIKNKLTNFKDDATIRQWFDMLGIGDKLDAKIGRMSFGQQQRVAMIRALVQPFDFLLADEPISHLDDNNSRIMADIMMTEAKAQGAGVIVTSIGKHMDLNYEKTLLL